MVANGEFDTLLAIHNFNYSAIDNNTELKNVFKTKIKTISNNIYKYIEENFPAYKSLFFHSNKNYEKKIINKYLISILNKNLFIKQIELLKDYLKTNAEKFKANDILNILNYTFKEIKRNILNGLSKLNRNLFTELLKIIETYTFINLVIAPFENFHKKIDPVTFLPYRPELKLAIEELTNKKGWYIFLLDIRKFSLINSNFGYEAGDALLKEVALKLKEHLKNPYYPKNIFRLRDDIFVILFKEKKPIILKKLNKLIFEIFSEPIKLKLNSSTKEIKVEFIAVGMELKKQNYSTILLILENALNDFKEKKNIGTYIINNENFKKYMNKQHKIKEAIDALLNNRVTFAIQSIVNIKTNKIFAYEVLARIMDKEGKIITAGSFIRDLEFSNISEEIDKAVIEKALNFKKTVNIPVPFSINVSADLLEKDFLFLERIAKKLKIEPQEIIIEITERKNIVRIENLKEIFSYLKKQGFKVFIDDFGIDYSNFHLINLLDIDGIKVDGTFVKSMENIINREFINFCIKIAEKLNIYIVLEQIENVEILKKLKKASLYRNLLGQGYLFDKPKLIEH